MKKSSDEEKQKTLERYRRLQDQKPKDPERWRRFVGTADEFIIVEKDGKRLHPTEFGIRPKAKKPKQKKKK